MKIPPIYSITPEILELLAKIDAHRIYLSSLDIPIPILQKLERSSLLKSSVYSAKIEGIEINEVADEAMKKKEISNILKAYHYIDVSIEENLRIASDQILRLHKIVMTGETNGKSAFRSEMGAIFNQSGEAVYLSPPPHKVKKYIDSLLDYINSDTEKFPLICALVTHLVFEKIHPFLDGNGRVGRLLIFFVLKSKNYRFNLFVPLEEYLESYKNQYYFYLDVGLENVNDYLVFMLKGFYEEIKDIKSLLSTELSKDKKLLLLSPRQEELYLIIKTHKVVSFNFIHRRFLKVPERTLRYDLKKLQEKGLIIKSGITKGSYYRIH